MKKHRNIPIFIPHLGCPNMCVFCNQRKISGRISFDRETVKGEIETALETIPAGCDCEIAFFGGSFTGIDRDLMVYLLDTAKYFVDNPTDGKAIISGIRMSTRPDYISPEIMEILFRYPVKTVELGIQSTDETVLKISKRGHTVADSENACRLVKSAGYTLVGQMMIGLPGADIASEMQTAEDICRFGADEVRVYPTVVFRETELQEMMNCGEYRPLELEDAVMRCKAVLNIFGKHNVRCIRLGLCASDNLSDPDEAVAGCNHPAIGDLVAGEIYYDRLREKLQKLKDSGIVPKKITVTVPHGDVSRAVGQHRKNIVRLKNEFGILDIKVCEGTEFTVEDMSRCI